MLESMARGLAILSWDSGETGNVVKQSGAGFAVPYGDVDALQEVLLGLIRNHPLRRQCSGAALGYIRRRGDWSQNAREILSRIHLLD